MKENSENNEKGMLDLYRELIRESLNSNERGCANNSSPKHAAIIIEELIDYSKTTFHAFCQKMSGDVWTESAMRKLVEAKDRGVQIGIVVYEKVANLPKELEDVVTLLDINKIPENKRDAYARLSHFAAADGKSARIERNANARTAVLLANHPDVIQRVEELYGMIEKQAKAA